MQDNCTLTNWTTSLGMYSVLNGRFTTDMNHDVTIYSMLLDVVVSQK